MARAAALVFLLALAGCAGMPQTQRAESPCAAGEATYACQIDRYMHATP